ncbi:hypothetical protein AAHE18_04G120300 [Arachis hypogaea]
MMVTLKDPTRTISARVHHKAASDGEYGKDITVGSVVVLQKVAVFAPTRSTCYLNITLRNILKGTSIRINSSFYLREADYTRYGYLLNVYMSAI